VPWLRAAPYVPVQPFFLSPEPFCLSPEASGKTRRQASSSQRLWACGLAICVTLESFSKKFEKKKKKKKKPGGSRGVAAPIKKVRAETIFRGLSPAKQVFIRYYGTCPLNTTLSRMTQCKLVTAINEIRSLF
jgi:hypothetical protein